MSLGTPLRRSFPRLNSDSPLLRNPNADFIRPPIRVIVAPKG